MEKRVTFRCQGFILEGIYHLINPAQAAVITHPHPVYGGDMHNAVVDTIAAAYQKRGWSTLRFNFRGTGNSQGSFDHGKGEQADIDAAIAYLTEKGVRKIELAGYSFGAWVLARRAKHTSEIDHGMRFVAPPVAFLDFGRIDTIQALKQVIVGTRDEFAPYDQVVSLTSHWNSTAELNAIDDADHFFGNHMASLQKVMETSIS